MKNFKKIFELVIIYKDGSVTSLLFAFKCDALYARDLKYAPGMKTANGIVKYSFVCDKKLYIM